MDTRKLELFIIEKDWDTWTMSDDNPLKHDRQFIEGGAWYSRTRTFDVPSKFIDSDKHNYKIKDKYKKRYETLLQKCLSDNYYSDLDENYYQTCMYR